MQKQLILGFYKLYMKRLLLPLLFLCFSCISFSEQREVFELTGQVAYYQKHVDKGAKKSDSVLHSIARADFFCEKANVYIAAERYEPTKNRNVFPNQHCINFGCDYKLTDFFSVDTGFKYNFQNTKVDQLGYWREIYTGVKADIILSPEIYLKHDFERRQWNIELSLGYEFELDELGMKNFAIDIDFSFGWLKAKKPFGPLRNSNWNRKIKYFYYSTDILLAYFLKENFAVKIGPSFAYNSDKKTTYSVPNEFSKNQRNFSVKFILEFIY